MNEREYDYLPNRFPLELSDFERECLAYLLERHPRNDLGEVIQGAFAKGVAIRVAEARRREGRVVRGHQERKPPPRHVDPWVTLPLVADDLRMRLQRFLDALRWTPFFGPRRLVVTVEPASLDLSVSCI